MDGPPLLLSWEGRFGTKEGFSMDVAVLGIDLGKNSCSVVGLDGSGKVVLRRRMQRKTIVAWPQGSRPASLQWKPVVVPIISAGFSQLTDTQFG